MLQVIHRWVKSDWWANWEHPSVRLRLLSFLRCELRPVPLRNLRNLQNYEGVRILYARNISTVPEKCSTLGRLSLGGPS